MKRLLVLFGLLATVQLIAQPTRTYVALGLAPNGSLIPLVSSSGAAVPGYYDQVRLLGAGSDGSFHYFATDANGNLSAGAVLGVTIPAIQIGCLGSADGSTLGWQTCSGGGGGSITTQTNSVNNSTQTVLNLINSVTNSAGLTSVFTNTTGGTVKDEIAGTLNATHGGTGSTSAPAAGQLPVGNAGGTAYAPTSLSGGATVNSSGVVTLGNPGASILGGIESITSLSHNWVAYIDTSGVPHQSQPAVGDVSGLGTGVATALGNVLNAVSGLVGYSGALGTPLSGNLANETGLPISTGVSGLGTGVAAALGNTLNAASGLVGYSGALGTPVSGVTTNLSGTCAACSIGGNAATVTTASSTTNSAFSILAATTASGAQAPATVSGFTINPNTGNVIIPGTLVADSLNYPTTLSSGGILYNSDGTHIASTSTLTQYGVLYGGGTGAAPGVTAAGGANTVLLSGSPPVFGTVPNTALQNTSVTVNGDGVLLASVGPTVALGASGAMSAANGASGAFYGNIGAAAGAPGFHTLSAVKSESTTYQVLDTDFSSYTTLVVPSGTFTITLVASGSQPAAGQYLNVINYGSGTVTIARSGQNINGGTSTLSLPAASATNPTSLQIVSDGSNYFASQITSGSAAGVTSFSGDSTVLNNSSSSGSVTATLANANAGTVLGNATASATTPTYHTLSAVNAQTATYQVTTTDFSAYKRISVASGTFTVTLVASGSQPAAGQYIDIVNYGSGVVTIARSGQNINGGTTSLILPAASATAPTSTRIISDGTNYFASQINATNTAANLGALMNIAANALVKSGGTSAAPGASAVSDNGTTVSSSESVSVTGSVTASAGIVAGSALASVGSATGIWACAEASTAGTPTAGQDYVRCDSTLHGHYVSNNGGSEFKSAMDLGLGTLTNSDYCTYNSATNMLVCNTAATAYQANGTPLTSTATINFENSAATNGLTLTFSNPSAGNVQLGLSGTLNNSGLTNSATTPNGQTCTLGSTCNVNSGAATHSVALNEGAGSAIAGAAIGTAGRLLIDQGAGADPSFNAMSQDCTITSTGVITCTKTNNVAFAGLATLTETDGDIVYGAASAWTKGTALPGGITATTQALGDATADVATDQFVANAVAATNPATSVLAATTGSNLTGTYNNGTSGVGATFTITATGAFSLDGVAINTIGQRVLIKDQSSAFQNGIYTATVVGTTGVSAVFTRATDYNQPSDINSTGPAFVQSGTANSTTSWLLTSTVTTVGTDSLTYAQSTVAPGSLVTAAANFTSGGLLYGGGANKTTSSSADFTVASHTITGGASAILDLSAESVTSGLKLPSAAGAAPTADGFLAVNTTTHALVSGSNGTTIVQAAAATGTNTSTVCASHNWVSTIASVAAPSCTQPAFTDVSGTAATTQVPAVSTVVDTSTPVTVSTTNPSEFHFNENVTAATAITYDLPTAAAGLQFCFSNAYNGSAANTGTLELLTSASGQFIIYTDGTLSATGGYVISGGAAADAACVVGVDSTHWRLYVQQGTWTKH